MAEEIKVRGGRVLNKDNKNISVLKEKRISSETYSDKK